MVGSGPKSGFNNLVLLPTHLIFRLQSGMWPHTRTTGPIAGDSFPLSWCLVSQLLILGMMGLPSLFKRLELNTRQFTAWPRSRNDFQNGVSCGCDKASVPAVSLNAHFQLNNSCRRTMDGNTQRLPELMHTSNIEVNQQLNCTVPDNQGLMFTRSKGNSEAWHTSSLIV